MEAVVKSGLVMVCGVVVRVEVELVVVFIVIFVVKLVVAVVVMASVVVVSSFSMMNEKKTSNQVNYGTI